MSLIGPSATLRPCGPCGRIALLLLSGLVITTLDIGGASAQPAPARRHEVRDPIAAHIAEAAQRFGIPERWIVAVLGAESAGDTHAVSHAGARGLMQVMPSTWDALRARYRLGLDPFDPRDNILAGAAYLRELYDQYGSPGFLAAYNAGPGRYDEYLVDGRPLPPETRDYVAVLAPYVDASAVSLTAISVQINRSDWTRSPLFVAQADGSAASVPAGSSVKPAIATQTQADRTDIDLTPRDSGLFVTPSQPNERQ